jgi:hypothetical protein
MSDFQVTKTRILAGIWEGVVDFIGTGEIREPGLVCLHDGTRIPSLTYVPDPEADGRWILRIAIPPHVLADGIQVFLVNDQDTGETLTQFSILTDEHFDEGLRREVALLRAELDIVKRAIRRIAVED